MKTSRLTIGIISIVLFFIIAFQSCAAGVANTLSENGSSSGSMGFLLALCMLIAGIVGISTKNSVGKGPYVAGGFYIVGGIIASCDIGVYKDLIIWVVVSIAFGLAFIIPNFLHNKKNK